MNRSVEINIDGPTGSGKSTIAIAIAASLRSSGFQVIVEGVDAGQDVTGDLMKQVAANMCRRGDTIIIREARRAGPDVLPLLAATDGDVGTTTDRQALAALCREPQARAISVEDVPEIQLGDGGARL